LANILVGTAGWSYDDWRGRVYPERAPASFDPLRLLAAHFDLVEINVSFYRLPRPEVVAGWLRRVREFPDFRFLLKAPRDWTHIRLGEAPAAPAPFRAVAELLAASGRLGAVLLQFPASVRDGAAARARIGALRARLPELPVAVEVRHNSFAGADWEGWLSDQDCLPVNIDQPALPGCLVLGAACGRAAAYFRLHGRNAAQWFAPDAGRDARYDYLYAPSELEAVAARIEEAARRVPLIFLVTNNHFRGQAAVNALQLRARLLGRPVLVPPLLLANYPELAAVALSAPRAQGELF
jgi:uncharacterized protein YecE (DUF72 family)